MAVTVPDFFNKVLRILLIASLGFVDDSFANTSSFSDLELAKIIEQQNKLLEIGRQWSEEELTRKAQEIVSSYENFLLRNPNNINALLLFGKFLRKTGLHDNAVSLFLQADQLNPNIAVVKQEIGNFLVETGKPEQAFPFFLMSTRLAPEEPIYHHNLGDFIFLFKNNLSEIDDPEKLGFLMHESFKEAAKLEPKNFDYQLRFAQSFFDFENSMLEEALIAWNTLLSGFGERTEKEKEYINIFRARILMEIGKKKEAILILRSIKSEEMLEEKKRLLEKSSLKENVKLKKSSFKIKSSNNSKNHGDFASLFPIDSNLRRIKALTAKLLQEQMLQDLENDALKAKVLPNGEISLELNNKSSDQKIFR